jgi:hypothetical protein
VEIVRNGERGALADSALLPREVLRIGVAEGDEKYQFFRIRSIAVADDGTLYVANAGSSTVRMYAKDGRHLQDIGGVGDGPGEFRSLARIVLEGDTLLALDTRRDQYQVFRRSGDFVGIWSGRSLEPGFLDPLGRGPGGWLVIMGKPLLTRPAGPVYRDTFHIQFVHELPRETADVSAVRMRNVVAIPWIRHFVTADGSADTPLFEPTPGFAVDGSGRVFTSPGAHYRIDVHSHEGRHARRISRAHNPVPLTRQLVDEYVSRVNAFYDTAAATGAGEGGSAPRQPSELKRAGFTRGREHLPPLGRLFAARDGAFWIERPDLADDPVAREWSRGVQPSPTKWDVFDTEGRFLGLVTLPAKFTPHVVATNSVTGVQRDEQDVEYVVRYEIGSRDAPGGPGR